MRPATTDESRCPPFEALASRCLPFVLGHPSPRVIIIEPALLEQVLRQVVLLDRVIAVQEDRCSARPEIVGSDRHESRIVAWYLSPLYLKSEMRECS